jgi:dTDP-4-dehydrorhamnose reductase
MKVVIFGAGGQVGKALAATAPVGAIVTTLDRSAVDITDRKAVATALGDIAPDLVINAAAYTAVDKAESDAVLAHAINGDAPGHMARAAAALGSRFVHVSTDFVFDGMSAAPYTVDAPTNPLSVYGASKRAGELAVISAGANALIVRTAWVYAAGGRNFVETMLSLMATRPSINVVADQIGTPTHADSLARAIWALAATDHRGILHYTDAGVASWYDFAVAIHDLGRAAGLIVADIAITPIPTSAYPTPAHRPACAVLDKAETWALLGWTADHWRRELAAMILKKRTNTQ